ncbi:hypothetical protein FLL45_15260 [Aliikangiella marina]|uniref:Anti sigma-E protein RseA N-terminal domain-containing protein n=1 Tax=Aliikangiella marina TaxID=1712262 RepID=A0A545T6H5_9GAMM|nr:sigma-E factor negative regulatory protein [Aliikangiella marina]TQV72824.1 hypothetical protein FLL45_15260 [Aliikangiella marina]
MSNNIKNNSLSQCEAQFISELLDGDCDAGSVDKLLGDDKHCETWYRYNQISAILRKEDSVFCSYQFTQAISEKIAEEPAIVAAANNAAVKSSSKLFSGNVVSFVKRTGGGLAIAASVAYAMVFSVELMNTQDEGFASPVQTVASQSAPSIEIANTIISAAELEEQAKLDEIQAILRQMRQTDRNVYEQQVGGEWIVSTVVRSNQIEEIQQQVQNMKKPSEVEDGDTQN